MAFRIIEQRLMMAAIGGATMVFAAITSELVIFIRITLFLIGSGLVYKSRFF